MPRKTNTLSNNLLSHLLTASGARPAVFSSPGKWVKQTWCEKYDSFRGAIYHLQRRGLLKIQKKQGKRLLLLTEQGELEALLAKAQIKKLTAWDGKWRMIIFDIPEDAKDKRNKLRHLLKRNNFYQLQKSVYLHPYSLNREAIRYLKETRLIDYIRIIRIDEMDDDSDLKKKFQLH